MLVLECLGYVGSALELANLSRDPLPRRLRRGVAEDESGPPRAPARLLVLDPRRMGYPSTTKVILTMSGDNT